MEKPDICSDCIHYNVCEDAYNYRSKCINYLSENDVIKQRMKYKQSEIKFGETLKMLDSLNPIKVVYNKKELYNDYDSKTVLRVLEDGDKVYGEDIPPNVIIPVRFPELLNKRVYAINIEIVDFHHSIIYMYGEK